MSTRRDRNRKAQAAEAVARYRELTELREELARAQIGVSLGILNAVPDPRAFAEYVAGLQERILAFGPDPRLAALLEADMALAAAGD